MTWIDLAMVLSGWIAGIVLLLDLRTLPRGGAARGTISVVVPARNEARRLPRLLAALGADAAAAGRPAGYELIVVDDGSTDGTAALAEAAGARVLTVDPPAGWVGKSWACWQGAHVATGDVLVFLDADTEPGPGFVGELAGAAERSGGLTSVQPWHRVERGYENASAMCNLVAVMGAGTGRVGHSRWWRRPVGYGPAMAVPRDAYLDAGGHCAVHDIVTEDLALAAYFDRCDLPVEAWAGGDVGYRMYPEGPASLVEGWTKNLAAGASGTAPARLLLVTLWIMGTLVAGRIALSLEMPTAPLVYLGTVALAAVLVRRVGGFRPIVALLAPVYVLAFIGLLGISGWRRLAGRPNVWRGRVLPERTR